jgi:hypothetical protein
MMMIQNRRKRSSFLVLDIYDNIFPTGGETAHWPLHSYTRWNFLVPAGDVPRVGEKNPHSSQSSGASAHHVRLCGLGTILRIKRQTKG